MKVRSRVVCLVAFVTLVGAPIAAAQTAQSGAITGVVRDTSGGVLPGVTVEATSPALIEKVRTAVTDGQGVYRIVDLRPGVYTVTFTLPGFAIVKREGLELTTGFTATANADLQVGTLEETVTVSGATPLVDVQNVRQQQVFARETMDSLPVGKTTTAYGALIPGAVVPGTISTGADIREPPGRTTVHGGPQDSRRTVDGMSVDNPMQPGGNGLLYVNRASIQEVNVEVGGMGAEAETGGVRMNIVPRDGGNSFSGYFSGDYSSGALQADNLTDEVARRNLQAAGALRRVYEVTGGVGGPIMRDRLWFYTPHMRQSSSSFIPGAYWNATPDSWVYTPDLSRPATADPYARSHGLRLTWQASPRNKFNITLDDQSNCACATGSATQAPEAGGLHTYRPVRYGVASWSFPMTNRLLIDAGGGVQRSTNDQLAPPGVRADHIAVQELATGFNYRARPTPFVENGSYATKDMVSVTQRFSVSYITGSHSFKTGFTAAQNSSKHTHTSNGDVTYRFLNGVPVELTQWATPWFHDENLSPMIGMYVQDQWTLRKLTLNLGVRYDTFNGWIPEQDLPAGTYVPRRHFAEIKDAVSWRDVSPRLGAAYDLAGDGRTALKVSLGRFVEYEGSAIIADAINPSNLMVSSATRTWNDVNRDFVPQPNELGPLSDINFGQIRAATAYARNVLHGFGNRPYNWQGAASVQRELWAGSSVNVGYFRTWFGNFRVTDNLAVTAADYDHYCVTAPVHAALPTSGTQICGLYDINPSKFGRVDNIVVLASERGKQSRVFNGIDVTVRSRFGAGGQVSGGLSTGATVTDDCGVRIDSPDTRFCRVAPPWSAGTQVKFLAVYPLPWDSQVSATLQNVAGPEILANARFTRAQVLPSLGRNLTSSTVTVPLIEPGTMYEDRINQLDIRLTKGMRLGAVRIQGSVDVFNVFNAGGILGRNNTFGSSWGNVTAVMPGRLVKFGASMNF